MKIPFKEVLEMIEWLHDDMGLSSVVTEMELAALLAETLVSVRDPFCTTCDVNTMEVGEYYVVNHDLWKRYGVGKGMMCIGCLEDRLGRELNPSDFADAPINSMGDKSRSERLKSRLGML